MQKTLYLLFFLIISISAGGYEFLGTVNGENIGDQFGSAFCAVDFNNDSYPDLVISAPASDEAGTSSGKVYIYFGGPSADLTPDLEITGEASSFFGKSLASAGDYNNDGAEDLLVGAPFYDSPASNAGAVYLFYGGTTPDITPDHIFTGEQENDYFGIAVTGIQDFNNDTYNDIAIGAYRADWGTFDDAGKVYLFFGGSSPDFDVDLTLTGEADGERFGYAISAGNFNGASVSDIAIGAYSYDDEFINQGRIYIFYGGSSPDASWDLTIDGSTAGDKYGWSLTAGNINNDPYNDLVMGTDGYSVNAYATGQIYIFHGGPALDAITDDSYTLGREANDYLGFSVASGVDINGDNLDEILAGMPGNDDGATDAGGAIVFTGGDPVAVDTTVFGTSGSEEMGGGVVFWPGYGDLSTFVLAIGAKYYDDFRGRTFFYRTSVSSENHPPVLDPIGDKFATLEELLTFTVTALDPDENVVNLFAENLPDGATFTNDGWDAGLGKYKGTFSWIPNASQEGSYENVRFIADDGEFTDDEFITITAGDYICGDVDDNGSINILDVVFLINYKYKGGPAPDPLESGNVDGIGEINILDVIYLINYKYKGGPSPNCS